MSESEPGLRYIMESKEHDNEENNLNKKIIKIMIINEKKVIMIQF